MHKLSVYLLLCCLSFNQLGAQDSNYLKPPQNGADTSKRLAKPAAKKQAADSCCKTMEQLKQDLVKLDAKELKQNYKNKPARETIQALNLIINRIINRENSYKFGVLEAIIKESQADKPKEKTPYTVRLMIMDRKSGAGVPLEGTILFDPAIDPAPYLNKIKDSSQTLNADLLANKNGMLIKFNDPENKPVYHIGPSPDPVSPDAADGLASNGHLLMLVVAGLCLLFGILAYLKSRSLLRRASAAGRSFAVSSLTESDLPAAAPEQEEANHKKQGNTPEQPARYTPGPYSQQPVAAPAESSVLHVSMPLAVPSKSHFFAEIMTTAGPRKKYVSEPGADKDLGEDVCGFVADDKDLLIYLLDGTSDLHCLRNPETDQEYFSSRLLAQSLANQLRLAFTTHHQEAIETVMLQAIQAVRQDWLRIIGSLPPQEKNRLKASIGNKSFPECATTLLIGRLSIYGKITVYRSGDSKMLVFSSRGNNKMALEETPLVHKNEQSNDRVFFRLILNADGDFDILHNKPNYEIVEKENIHTVIAFSDGIGTLTEQLLQQRYAVNAEETRKEIFYQVQGTADDKAICFITIRN